ncbi:MAG: hypothetical protein MUQ51_00965 [Pseudomonadota bacterium]|nr:hypothetical protein [Pseudomonadota bacterium]
MKVLLGLADSFGRRVITEGIETAEDGITLLLMDCNSDPDFEMSRPLPAEEFPTWLKTIYPIQNGLDTAL